MGKVQPASFLLMVAIVACLMMHSTKAFVHAVGGELGWSPPPRPDFYCQWAATRTFGVGDELVFTYKPGAETLLQVSKEDFERCGHEHVINQWITGPTRLPLAAPGDYYFYSGVGTHCEMGQKLHIVVSTKPGSDGANRNATVHASLPIRKLLAPSLATRWEVSLS